MTNCVVNTYFKIEISMEVKVFRISKSVVSWDIFVGRENKERERERDPQSPRQFSQGEIYKEQSKSD